MYLQFNNAVELFDQLQDAHSEKIQWLSLITDRYANALPDLFEAAKQRNICFCQTLFSGIIDGTNSDQSGLFAIPFPESSQVLTATLAEESLEWHSDLPLPDSVASSSAMIFVDCKPPNISHFLGLIYDQYGTRIDYVCAGSGFNHLRHEVSIFPLTIGKQSEEDVVRHPVEIYEHDEMVALSNDQLEGVLALGDKCGNKRSRLEFYNKTFVNSLEV